MRTCFIATLAATSLTLALLLAPAAAEAQRRPGYEVPSLFFLTLTGGLGDCAGYDCDFEEADTGPLFGFGAGFYVRPIAYFAAGIDAHLNFMTADDRDDRRVDEIANYWLFNFAARGILPLGRVEPWGGVGFGFTGWNYYWVRDGRERQDSLSGLDFAFALGLDVALNDHFWVGGTFRYAFPFWNDACDVDDSGRERCEPVDNLDVDEQHELPDGLWYFGVTGRLDIDV